MKTERVLSLDVSTKTGWASLLSAESGMTLEGYGTLSAIHQPDSAYPGSYVDWAKACFAKILELVNKYKPDVLVIEETSKGSKNAMSQKILEYIHYLLAELIQKTPFRSVYVLTEQWRREIGCKMNDAEKEKNKEVRDYKKAYEKEHGKKTKIAYDINGKRIGLVGRKHVNIRRVSEIFAGQLKKPLLRKDEDLADGLGLAACYHMRRFKDDKSQEVTMEDILEDNL